eukprot:gene15264-21346_t
MKVPRNESLTASWFDRSSSLIFLTEVGSPSHASTNGSTVDGGRAGVWKQERTNAMSPKRLKRLFCILTIRV